MFIQLFLEMLDVDANVCLIVARDGATANVEGQVFAVCAKTVFVGVAAVHAIDDGFRMLTAVGTHTAQMAEHTVIVQAVNMLIDFFAKHIGQKCICVRMFKERAPVFITIPTEVDAKMPHTKGLCRGIRKEKPLRWLIRCCHAIFPLSFAFFAG